MTIARTQSKLARAALTLAGVAAATLTLTYSPTSSADEVSPTGKGIAGGALLGGEVVTITESIIGVHAGWAYWLGGALGAGGGAVGGYYVEKSSTDAHASVYMLAGGLALVIPALVLSLNSTRYQADEGATEDRAPTGPVADPGDVPAAAPAPAPGKPQAMGHRRMQASAPSMIPMSLVDVRGGDLRIGVPIPEVRQLWTTAQMSQYGLQQGTEVRVPVMSMSF